MAVLPESGASKETSSVVFIEHPLICFELRNNWHDLAIVDICLACIDVSKLGKVSGFGLKNDLELPVDAELPSLHYEVKYGTFGKAYALNIELVEPGGRVISSSGSDLQFEFNKGKWIQRGPSARIELSKPSSDNEASESCMFEVKSTGGHRFELIFPRRLELAKLGRMLTFCESGHWIDFAENAGFSLKRISS